MRNSPLLDKEVDIYNNSSTIALQSVKTWFFCHIIYNYFRKNFAFIHLAEPTPLHFNAIVID